MSMTHAEPTAESTSRTVTVNGAELHYHDTGGTDDPSAPVLLCIHGGAPGAYGWGNFGPVVPALARHLRLLVPDLPGYGRSGRPEAEGGRYEADARAFAAMLDALGIERAHVLGMATGGAVALAMAVHVPDVVDRLILVSSAGGLPLFTPTPSEGQRVIRDYYAGAGPSPEKMRGYLEMMLYDAASITDELVRDRYEESVRHRVADGAAPGRPPEALWKELDRVRAETLILWGRENRVQGYDNALFMLKAIPRADMHVFGRAGLWLPFERAAAFSREVIGFLG